MTEDGKTYEGSFVNDLKHGFGILKYENGDFYQGEWNKN